MRSIRARCDGAIAVRCSGSRMPGIDMESAIDRGSVARMQIPARLCEIIPTGQYVLRNFAPERRGLACCAKDHSRFAVDSGAVDLCPKTGDLAGRHPGLRIEQHVPV